MSASVSGNAVPTAYFVDDDEAIRTLWRWLMESNSIPVRIYESAPQFITSYRRGDPGCLVLDINLPGMNGLELQEFLKREGVEIPIVFVTGFGDVSSAVSALKGGAVDFIQKPFDYRMVVDVIRKALARDVEARAARASRALLDARIAALTDRERDVLRKVIEGKQNKVIAAELDISMKTVEAHRSKVMEKMGAGSLAELVQLTLGFSPSTPRTGD
jgi:FixJ family two-component response regulator